MHEDEQKSRKHNQEFSYQDNLLQVKLNESWACRRLVEALNQLPPNNLSSSLDMKFQKKQMLEREQKKLSLTVGDFSHASKKAIGNGKVRQMFDDRRRGVVGIDRSHPLRPIMASTTSINTTTKQSTTNKRLAGGAIAARRSVLSNTTSLQSTTTSLNSFNNNFSASNGNLDVFDKNLDQVDNIDNESFPKEFSMLSLDNPHVMRSFVENSTEFKNNNIDEGSILDGTIVINKKKSAETNGIKLNPVITKKSPATAKTTIRNTSGGTRASLLSKTTTSSIKSPPPKAAVSSATNKKIKTVGTKSKPATFILSVKPPPRIITPPPGMASCPHCQRHFNEERLGKHEEVCRKMTSKKRKIFDASTHRVKGTEAEKYLKKGKLFTSAATKAITSAASTPQTAKKSDEKKSNWRKKHEEFITAIREAKKVQAYLAKGGKLSDLPPPPPSENPDYVQCPHCSRRFNESAAERHIPKCANMQHNKPKPGKKRF